MYIVVCYLVIVATYVRSVGPVFAYLYNFDDDLERPMDYETSLILNCFLQCVFDNQAQHVTGIQSL